MVNAPALESTGGPLPDYAAEMRAMHAAHGKELRSLFSFAPGSRVLDVGCGEGDWTRTLAEGVGDGGEVVGLDVNPSFLEAARRRTPEANPARQRIRWMKGDIHQVEFASDAFDGAVVGQGLLSLPQPIAVLRRLTLWVRPQGQICILENDRLHHQILPWSVETELDLLWAESEWARASESDPGMGVGRNLLRWCAVAGVPSAELQVRTVLRHTPLRGPDWGWARLRIEGLLERNRQRLKSASRDELASFLTPDSPLLQPGHFVCVPYLWVTAESPS